MKTTMQIVVALVIVFILYSVGIWGLAEWKYRQCTAADTPQARMEREFEESSRAIASLNSAYFQDKLRQTQEDIALAKLGKRRLTHCEIPYYVNGGWIANLHQYE
jgi:hypothetical protein